MRQGCAIVALSALIAAGLSGQTPRERDSAGVTIVVNRRTASPPTALSLSRQPTCVVPAGGARGDLTSAPSAFLLSDRRLVVANAAERRLELYSCAGTAALIAARGRRGRGPGEFTNIAAVFHGRGDTLIVTQSYTAPIAVLDGQGNPVTTYAAHGNVVCCFDNGTFLLGRSTPRTNAGARSGFAYYRYDPGTQTEDSTPVAFLPGSDASPATRTSTRGNTTVKSIMLQPAPFGHLSSIRILGNGFVAGTGEEYVVGVYAADGKLLRSIRVDEPPRAVGAREKAAYIADELRDLEGAERQRRERELARVAFPNRMPAYRRIEVADHSCIWVERYPASDAENGSWDVFSSAGRLIGTMHVPAGARLMSVQWPFTVLRRANVDGFIEIGVYAIVGADLEVGPNRSKPIGLACGTI